MVQVALGLVELHLGEVDSLKGKRHVLRGMKEKVKHRFNVSDRRGRSRRPVAARDAGGCVRVERRPAGQRGRLEGGQLHRIPLGRRGHRRPRRGAVTSVRLQRVNQLIREEISHLVQRELKDPRLGFVTVTEVDVAKDLRTAKVYVSVLGPRPVAGLARGARERPRIHPELARPAAPLASRPPPHVPPGPLDGPRGPHPDGARGAQERGAAVRRARTGDSRREPRSRRRSWRAVERRRRVLLFAHVYPDGDVLGVAARARPRAPRRRVGR